jgi:ABC-type transport system involved in multi-copper enzyme maturation permease subunit
MYKQYINNIEEHSYKTTDPNEILIKKQPSVLSIYISGTQELMDRTFIFNRDVYEPMELSAGINLNIFRQLFPTLDFLYLVKMLFSLLALILSFDLICGEKNEGTLKLILTNTVSKGEIIFGKLIANYILLIFPILIVFILNIVLLGISSKVELKSDDYFRLFIILLFSFIYLGGFLSIGILVSSLSSSSQNSLIVCFIVWIVLLIIIPTTSSLISKNVSEIPNERIFEEKKQWLINAEGTADNAKTNINQLTNDFRNKLAKHIKLNASLNRTTPSGAYSILTTNVAGYGFEDEMNLRKSISGFVDNIRHNNNLNEQFFNYKRNSLTSALGKSMSDIAILLIFPTLSFFLAFLAFKKYDVR